MAEEDGFDDGADDGLFVVVEVLDGFEVVEEIVVGAAFIGFEDEPIGAYGEHECESTEDVEGGLGAAGFVTAEPTDLDADAFGEGLLGEGSLSARGGEAFGEVHVQARGGVVGISPVTSTAS